MLHAKARRPLSHSWRIVPILTIIAIITFIVICLSCRAEIKAIIPFVSDLIESGKSLFIPSIPDVNVFSYMPPEFHMRLPLGQLVDGIIITYIVSSFFYFGYPYYKALKGTTSLQFVYIDKTGVLNERIIESPLSKTFLIGSGQLALMDFEQFLDQERSRETKAQRLHEFSSFSEPQEKSSTSKYEHGRRKRTPSGQVKNLNNCKSPCQFSFFASSAFNKSLHRVLFLLHHSHHEIITWQLSGISLFQEKSNKGGK